MADDDFLTRWSRRKQAAAVDARRAKEGTSDVPEQPAEAPAKDELPKDEPAFDPATLPPIDSITAITDVRDFLRAGVPAELTRAALRRAWTADPAIRDFIGLAENSWDFTAPDGVPGFGPLDASPEEIRQLVDQIISRTSDLAEAVPEPSDPPASVVQPPAQPQVIANPTPSPVANDRVGDDAAATQTASLSEPDVASQQDSSGDDDHRQRPRRSRGGALPR